MTGCCTHGSEFWPKSRLDQDSVSVLIQNVRRINSPIKASVCDVCYLSNMSICRKNVLKRNPQSSVNSFGLSSSNSHAVCLHRLDSYCVICICFHYTGGIIPLQPDPVFARKPHGASFLGAHVFYIATRRVSGAKAQYTLPAICLPLLSNFQVR